MKQRIHFAILCMSAVLLASCNDEEMINGGNNMPQPSGNEVTFTANTQYNTSQGTSRTAYGNVIGEVQKIEWDDNDIVQVYSAEVSAPADKTVDYQISPNLNTDGVAKDFAALKRSPKEEIGLQWGTADKHTFYAMYPSTEMVADEEAYIKDNVKLDGSTLTAYIPNVQSGAITYNSDSKMYTVAPDMTYAYMAAKTLTATSGGSISLEFYPIITTIEVTLALPDDANNEEIKISGIQFSSKYALTGAFTSDLSLWDNGSTGLPTCINSTDNTDTKLYIPLWTSDSEGQQIPLTLKKGEKIKATAFLLPGDDIKDLSISIVFPNGTPLTKSLIKEGSGEFKIKKQTKFNINGLDMPDNLTINFDRWMSQIDDNVTLAHLSIPGTGASFSYNYNSSDKQFFQAQTLNFNQQWAAGIRAFEIISDRPSSTSYNASNHLGKEDAKCNAKSVGITLSKAFDEVLNKLNATATVDYPCGTEFAFVMLTYQPEGTSIGRNAAEYTKALAAFFDTELCKGKYIQDANGNTLSEPRFVQYSPDLTVADARGKILVAVRASQHEEDEDAAHNIDKYLVYGSGSEKKYIPFMAIKGCGTAKDKWGCRGYKVSIKGDGNFVRALDIQPSGNDKEKVDGYYKYPLIENYMLVDTTESNIENVIWPVWQNKHVQRPSAEDANFEYETNILKTGYVSQYYKVWCQEWARVVPTGGIQLNLGRCTGFLNSEQHYYYVYWHESYDEKVTQVKRAFEKAIADAEHNKEYVYINSLCGYYVDASNRNSCIPYADDPCESTSHDWFGTFDWPVGGLQGNIEGLAKDLNNMLYNYIIEKGYQKGTGPIGVVFMDRVINENTAGNEGSYYLPGVIVTNNFMTRY